jgi:hypothetical protein
VERLRSLAARGHVSAAQVLAYFSAESLRGVAVRVGIRAAGKEASVTGLVAILAEPCSPPAQSGATTIESIRDFVVTLSGSYRSIASEADAEWVLASALADHFPDVRRQAQVPGQFGHRIDIDIQNGQFGVEVKWAPALIESSSEAYRSLGQAVYYDRRRYAGRLLVVIVGPEHLRQHPVVVEVGDLLGALAVSCVYLTVHSPY